MYWRPKGTTISDLVIKVVIVGSIIAHNLKVKVIKVGTFIIRLISFRANLVGHLGNTLDKK